MDAVLSSEDCDQVCSSCEQPLSMSKLIGNCRGMTAYNDAWHILMLDDQRSYILVGSHHDVLTTASNAWLLFFVVLGSDESEIRVKRVSNDYATGGFSLGMKD